MEDALVQGVYISTETNVVVLILVLMEDALVLRRNIYCDQMNESLNPCFNGRCTRTYVYDTEKDKYVSLNPCFNGRCTRTYK